MCINSCGLQPLSSRHLLYRWIAHDVTPQRRYSDIWRWSYIFHPSPSACILAISESSLAVSLLQPYANLKLWHNPSVCKWHILRWHMSWRKLLLQEKKHFPSSSYAQWCDAMCESLISWNISIRAMINMNVQRHDMSGEVWNMTMMKNKHPFTHAGMLSHVLRTPLFKTPFVFYMYMTETQSNLCVVLGTKGCSCLCWAPQSVASLYNNQKKRSLMGQEWRMMLVSGGITI